MVLAFPILVLTCMSDPLVLSTSMHKYVKYVAYPVFLSNFQAIGYGKVFVLSTLIFLELILNPVSYANLSHCLLQHFPASAGGCQDDVICKIQVIKL